MVSSIRKWVAETFLVRGLKAALDKIPANYAKTVIGGLLLALSAVITSVCSVAQPWEYCGYLKLTLTIVEGYNITPEEVFTGTGTIALITGGIHKVLKWLTGDPVVIKPKKENS